MIGAPGVFPRLEGRYTILRGPGLWLRGRHAAGIAGPFAILSRCILFFAGTAVAQVEEAIREERARVVRRRAAH